MDRRTLIKLLATSPVLGCLPETNKKSNKKEDEFVTQYGPVDRTVPETAPQKWFGDEVDGAHKVLWDLPEKYPPVSEEVNIVVIGGGISGLASAWYLREYKPVILEQASRFGGNAKGQSFGGTEYSIGAAYMTETEDGDVWDKFYKELGVDKLWKTARESNNIIMGPEGGEKSIFHHFWEGESDPANKQDFLKVKKVFEDVLNEENGELFPDFYRPVGKYLESLKEKDTITLKAFLESKVGKLHPHVEHLLEFYCWTSLGVGLDEVNAAAGLNFYASEFGALRCTPAGNSSVAEQVLKKLREHTPDENLRTSCITTSVEVDESGVNISYVTRDGKAKTIRAKAAIMACPKFVCKKVVKNLEAKRVEAMEQIGYRSFLLCNAVLKTKSKHLDNYECFLMYNSYPNFKKKEEISRHQNATDLVFANYANGPGDNAILTMYCPLPYEARAEILDDESYRKYRNRFTQQLVDTVLPRLGYDKRSLKDVRLSRWGHPICYSKPGAANAGIFDQIRKPFKDRLFFVHQDNWALPAIETSIGEAETFSSMAKKLMV